MMVAWGVFYRRPEPRFKVPLDRAVLSDPAFSDDPRAHPHHDARAHRTPPAPSSPQPPPASHPVPVPLPQRKPPVSRNGSIPRKARMKALVRRLTTRHSLDRIDELDETDPFGGSHHHGGPYEAVATTAPPPTLPHPHDDTPPKHHSAPEFDPRSLRLAQHQAPRVPSIHAEAGLSLRLQPGQILQQNTVYASHVFATPPLPTQSRPPPTVAAALPRPDYTRGQSTPTWTDSLEKHSPLDLPYRAQGRPSSLPAPRERHAADHVLNDPPLHHDPDPAPYVLRQTDTPVFPPPRYESRLHSPGPSRSLQHTPFPSTTIIPVTAVPFHVPKHRNAHSLDASYTINGIIAQSSPSIHPKPLEPLRMRHLPKRLVMPALLEPRPPQPQYNFPSPNPAARQEEHSGDHDLEPAHFASKPTVYIQQPRLLRKRSSAFPAKQPMPDHVPVSQDDTVPAMETPLAKMATEAEDTKERTRRRRLSKRKNDI